MFEFLMKYYNLDFKIYIYKKDSDWAVKGKGRKGDSIGAKLGRRTRGR